MMKTVLLFGLLPTVFFGDVTCLFPTCAYPPTVKNFNASLFEGKWYVAERYGQMVNLVTVRCPTMNLTSDDTYGDITATTQAITRMTGSTVTTMTYLKHHLDGVYYFDEKLPSGFLRTAIFLILGTDYDNWAVTYKCSRGIFIKLDSAMVLTRERTASVKEQDYDADVTASLAKAGLPRALAMPTHQAYCNN